jgi:hypothetical protein
MSDVAPNVETVRNAAFLLGSMSTADARDALRRIINATYEGMVEHFGMSQRDAIDFAARFADAVIAEVEAMPQPSEARH